MKIIFCLPGDQYSNNFLICWSELLLTCLQKGHQILLSQNYSSVVHFARSLCLGGDLLRGINQKPFNEKIDYDYIMWVDSDMVFSHEDFLKLLESPHDITSGLYRMADRKNFATVKNMDDNLLLENGHYEFLSVDELLKYKEDETNDRYLSVGYTGMGWMLIKKGVIESLEYPWFYRNATSLTKNNIDVKEMMSEDVAFCKNLLDKGYKVHVDTNVIVGHEKKVIL